MDNLLEKFSEVFVFIDDILIVTKGTKEEHLAKVREILETINQENSLLKATKCKIAKDEIEWLGFKLTRSGISPINEKVQGITGRLRPRNSRFTLIFMSSEPNE